MERYRWLVLLLLLIVGTGLGYGVLSVSQQKLELQFMVADKMEISGVSNPVTAVLLNFRGYDTFLEMVVLLLALLGVWSLSGGVLKREAMVGSVLENFARLLVPIFILVAGYLLWIGAYAPGGAFQAGSVIGAAGVLLLLAGWLPRPHLTALPLRVSLAAGSAIFLIVGIYTLMSEGQVLKYPESQAGTLILIIETAASLSIGVTLTALFLGYLPTNKKDIG